MGLLFALLWAWAFTIGDCVEILTVRDGLPNFYDKVDRGEYMRINFMGGSVTALDHCWRDQTMHMLKHMYPHNVWAEKNAGVPATGSRIGVFRATEDVIVHNPDLVFIEFATNDRADCDQGHSLTIRRDLEGIVRQIWRQLPSCDIIFLYTVVFLTTAGYREGKMPPIMALHEEVAVAYGIPSIHLGLNVALADQLGKVVWKGPMPKTIQEWLDPNAKYVFALDGIHPYQVTGCQEYTSVIQSSLIQMRNSSSSAMAVGRKHILAPPIDPLNHDHAGWIHRTYFTISPEVEWIPKSDLYQDRWKAILGKDVQASVAGDGVYYMGGPGPTMSLAFNGTAISMMALTGPFSGNLQLSLDGGAPYTYTVFSTFCRNIRTGYFILTPENLEHGVHVLKVGVSPEPIDKVKLMGEKGWHIDPKYSNQRHLFINRFGVIGEAVHGRSLVTQSQKKQYDGFT